MEYVFVGTKIPEDVIRRLDIHLAKLRLALVESRQEDAILPTRSSFIREAVLAKLNNGKK